jgi:hypothetical protein
VIDRTNHFGAVDIHAGWLNCCSPHAIPLRHPHGECDENTNEGANECSAFENVHHLNAPHLSFGEAAPRMALI